jgi:hypothetical protein
MRERLTTLAGALAALIIVYALFFGGRESAPEPPRPVTAEAAGDGLRGLFLWLTAEGIPTHSLRERYTVLPALERPIRQPLARQGRGQISAGEAHRLGHELRRRGVGEAIAGERHRSPRLDRLPHHRRLVDAEIRVEVRRLDG